MSPSLDALCNQKTFSPDSGPSLIAMDHRAAEQFDAAPPHELFQSAVGLDEKILIRAHKNGDPGLLFQRYPVEGNQLPDGLDLHPDGVAILDKPPKPSRFERLTKYVPDYVGRT